MGKVKEKAMEIVAYGTWRDVLEFYDDLLICDEEQARRIYSNLRKMFTRGLKPGYKIVNGKIVHGRSQDNL